MNRPKGALDYSVVVVHYGEVARTERCLDSFRALDPQPRAVIVVWNGPGTPAFTHPRVTDWVAPERNLGFAAGANRGCDAALTQVETDALLLLNNDTQLDRNPVRRQLEVLEQSPDVACVGPRIVTLGGAIWHDGGRIVWPEGRPRGLRTESPTDVDFVCGCAPLLRTTAFREVGGFDERYFLTYEDADLGFRLRASGWRLLHDPEAVVIHEGGATLDREASLARYYRLRNRLLFARDHAPDPEATRRASARLRRKSRMRALRWYLTGRADEARALWAALRDAKAEKFGSRDV